MASKSNRMFGEEIRGSSFIREPQPVPNEDL